MYKLCFRNSWDEKNSTWTPRGKCRDHSCATRLLHPRSYWSCNTAYKAPYERQTPQMQTHESLIPHYIEEEHTWLKYAAEVVNSSAEDTPDDLGLTSFVFQSRQEGSVKPHYQCTGNGISSCSLSNRTLPWCKSTVSIWKQRPKTIRFVDLCKGDKG